MGDAAGFMATNANETVALRPSLSLSVARVAISSRTIPAQRDGLNCLVVALSSPDVHRRGDAPLLNFGS